MSLVTDLVEHYQLLVESGELAPEDVPGPKALREKWGLSRTMADRIRADLLRAGLATKLDAALPLGPIDDMTMEFEFWPRVLPRNADGCLVWDATVSAGYGRFHLNGTQVQAHRVAYEYRHGPVPPGLELDHVFERGCRSKLCVNHEHLESVTRSQNIRRMIAAQRWMAGIQVVTELDTD